MIKVKNIFVLFVVYTTSLYSMIVPAEYENQHYKTIVAIDQLSPKAPTESHQTKITMRILNHNNLALANIELLFPTSNKDEDLNIFGPITFFDINNNNDTMLTLIGRSKEFSMPTLDRYSFLINNKELPKKDIDNFETYKDYILLSIDNYYTNAKGKKINLLNVYHKKDKELFNLALSSKANNKYQLTQNNCIKCIVEPFIAINTYQKNQDDSKEFLSPAQIVWLSEAHRTSIYIYDTLKKKEKDLSVSSAQNITYNRSTQLLLVQSTKGEIMPIILPEQTKISTADHSKLFLDRKKISLPVTLLPPTPTNASTFSPPHPNSNGWNKYKYIIFPFSIFLLFALNYKYHLVSYLSGKFLDEKHS